MRVTRGDNNPTVLEYYRKSYQKNPTAKSGGEVPRRFGTLRNGIKPTPGQYTGNSTYPMKFVDNFYP